MAKAVDVAQKIIALGDKKCNATMTQMKLLKLTYIAHGFMLAIHDKVLIDEHVEAWKYGPVIPQLREQIAHFKKGIISKVPTAKANTKFSAAAIRVIKKVCETYGQCNGMKLSSMTHMDGTPWHYVYVVRKDVGGIIPEGLIKYYYQSFGKKSN